MILELKNLSKSFGGLRAVDHVTLAFEPQELRCVIGPNGAGKTTLFNLITGRIKADEGEVIFEGKNITHLKPYQISQKGIARKFQMTKVFEDLTVWENLLVAAMGHQRIGWRAFSRKVEKSVLDSLQEVMELVHLGHRGNELAYILSHGEKQWLEIGMVLAYSPQIMLLDEPTAGMSPNETMETSQIIKRISQNITTVVIEHDIKFLKEIGQNVTVLHRGAVLAEGTFDEIAENSLVRDVYLGRRG
ncbi:MAG TPA: ATP-binding cassette domain-containing protein [Thermodesulfobacteriota bacterium]|nr:ATP-binding cassette domain-containing protein [Thermodesulfobacteriota bacterium]